MLRSQIGMMILYLSLVIALAFPARADSDGTTTLAQLAQSHQHRWFNGKRNPAGEWCCGEGDCFMIPADLVRSTADGFIITLMDVSGYGQDEFVLERETQPSPDGQHWRCQRPDRSRRCFFAPPPAT